MKITKYEHACLMIEEGKGSLIIDPGLFSTSLEKQQNIEAIVVTHIHPDHFDPEKVKKLVEDNPSAKVLSTPEVVSELDRQNIDAQAVKEGDNISTPSFNLQFFGGTHAVIHRDFPVTQNSGVLINNKLYYPGDSFTLPAIDVPFLAVPISGPWLKASEVIDFMRAVKPSLTFPTHDALFNEIGHEVMGDWVKLACQEIGSEYKLLNTSESISV